MAIYSQKFSIGGVVSFGGTSEQLAKFFTPRVYNSKGVQIPCSFYNRHQDRVTYTISSDYA